MFYLQPSWADRESPARLATSPSRVAVNEGIFTLTVIAESAIPVNTFSGELYFDPAIVSVDAINYHSSIANLWVNEPSYDNSKGTISFVGGTTQVGGFVGGGTLFTVTFRTQNSGVTTIGFTEGVLLQHDGYGTPVDLEMFSGTVVTITPRMVIQNTQSSQISPSISEDSASDISAFDLNGDGELSFSDVGVLIEFMDTGNPKADFDGNGIVTDKDLEILLRQIYH